MDYSYSGIINYMTSTVKKLTQQVKELPQEELEEFLSWLAEYELEHSDEWDTQIERDSKLGGPLDSVLMRVKEDIVAGRVKPLDEVINDS